jgi:hypothetical protein
MLLLLAVGGCAALSCRDAPLPEVAKKPANAPLLKVDVHLHIDLRVGEQALAILEENGIVLGLNASGGEPGPELAESLRFARSHGDRLLPLCNFRFSALREPDFAAYASSALASCKAGGGRGLKVSKFLGLGLTDDSGALVAVDDPRLDPVFEAAGELGLPVLIHSGDPKAFFAPNTPDNERYDELHVHPGWSFHGVAPNGQTWPSWETLLQQHEARIARHPKTTFIGAHFGNAAEEPQRVARMLRAYPNYFIDTAARVPEFGRHAADRMRRFFLEFRTRVLFGSDLGVGPDGLTLGSGGDRPGTRAEAGPFFERHWAYFETSGKKMTHPTPIQGRWTIDGISLPREVLADVYANNALRLFGLPLPRRSRD